MIRISSLQVYNLDGALRGMRHPMNSHHLSDSYWDEKTGEYIIGDEDKTLALKLIRGGSDHAKFMRQIFVCMDIEAPATWWTEFDTYKVATVRNSSSRMHKMGLKVLTPDDFSFDDNDGEQDLTTFREYVIADLNRRIQLWEQLKDEGKTGEAHNVWRSIINDTPMGFNYKSTWTGNYASLRNMYHQRNKHKLGEWREFCQILTDELPYPEFITTPRRVRE